MRIGFIIIVIFIASCGTKPTSTEGTNFLVKDQQDTVSFFFYEYYDNYEFMDKTDFDSAIFNKQAQSRIPGRYMLGIIEKEQFLNRYLTFKGDSLSELSDFGEPTQYFLEEEYELADYELVILEDFIDSTTNFLTKYQTLVAVTSTSRDTLLFQEMSFIQKPTHVTFSLLTYETWDIREQMNSLISDAVTTMKKSTEPNKH
ncbi:MAG: hypothetical protein RIF46_05435 [Cyclobacteriaceae bacterium]